MSEARRPPRWFFSAEPGGWLARRQAPEGGAYVVGPTLAFIHLVGAIDSIERGAGFELKWVRPAADRSSFCSKRDGSLLCGPASRPRQRVRLRATFGDPLMGEIHDTELWAVVATGCDDCGRPVAVLGVCGTRHMADSLRSQALDGGIRATERTGVPPLCLRISVHQVGERATSTAENS